MTHVRFNRLPFQNVLDQFITEAFDQVVPAIQNQFARPAANIMETDKDFQLQIVAPGFAKSDLKIGVEKQILKISAKKEAESENSMNHLRLREFSIKSFERSFTLPELVDQDAIEARFENGILLVTIPKKEEAVIEAKTIEIS